MIFWFSVSSISCFNRLIISKKEPVSLFSPTMLFFLGRLSSPDFPLTRFSSTLIFLTGGWRLVPFTWLNLQVSVKHSPFRRESMHILGWKCSHFLPLAHPRGCLVPCWVNLLQTFGWLYLHSLPFIPCLQFPSRK